MNMIEGQSTTSDLRTLGRILAPVSPEATTLRRNSQTGEPTVLIEAVGLSLPEDFVMTDFDAFVLNHLYGSASSAQIASLVRDEFARRGINEAGVDKDTIINYFEVLRGKGGPKDRSKPPLCGSFPSIRTRYNAMRMLETGEFLDYKRDLQYITATSFAEGKHAVEVRRAWGISSTAPIIDMMMLDLSETAPDELNQTVEECVHDYSATYPNNFSYEDWMGDFKAGFILEKPPRSAWKRFDQIINQAVSRLWLDKLSADQTLFRAEDMKYVRKVLEIFVRGFGGATGKGRSETQLVNTWMRDTYRVSSLHMGTFVVRINMGLNWDRKSVLDLIDRGFDLIILEGN